MFDLIHDSASVYTKAGIDRHHPIQQSAEFLNALRENAQHPVVLSDLNNIQVLIKPLKFGRRIAMINRLPRLAPDRLFANLKKDALRNIPIILSPDQPMPELAKHGAVPLMSPARVAVLSLSQNRDAMRATLHQKWRNRLRHGEKQNLRVTRQNLPQDPTHWLFSADRVQGAVRGYQSWPIALTLSYARANKGQAKLFQVFDGDKPVAAILVLTHGTSATYHVAHTTERGKLLSAHNVLMWHVMEWLARKEIKTLELGIVNTEDAPGLARFKLGTGAHLRQLGGTWVYWHPVRKIIRPLAQLDQRLMRV